ncbi:MAG: hypothetical protein JW774_02205 [Candidatus Aureabacteria bacterium]|nr:hypothetical protein [Candidatus Auribacterota bacterium]
MMIRKFLSGSIMVFVLFCYVYPLYAVTNSALAPNSSVNGTFLLKRVTLDPNDRGAFTDMMDLIEANFPPEERRPATRAGRLRVAGLMQRHGGNWDVFMAEYTAQKLSDGLVTGLSFEELLERENFYAYIYYFHEIPIAVGIFIKINDQFVLGDYITVSTKKVPKELLPEIQGVSGDLFGQFFDFVESQLGSGISVLIECEKPSMRSDQRPDREDKRKVARIAWYTRSLGFTFIKNPSTEDMLEYLLPSVSGTPASVAIFMHPMKNSPYAGLRRNEPSIWGGWFQGEKAPVIEVAPETCGLIIANLRAQYLAPDAVLPTDFPGKASG